MHSISTETAERALESLAHSYRLSLQQYGVEMYSRLGIEPAQLDQKDTWIEINGKAVAEVWASLGGPRVKDYVLAQEIDDGSSDDALYRRYRILRLGDGVAIATAAWSGADERGEYAIDLATVTYSG